MEASTGDEFVTAKEYIDAEEGLSTCHMWEEHENWREELREIALEDEHLPMAKRAELEDSDEDTDIEEETSHQSVFFKQTMKHWSVLHFYY